MEIKATSRLTQVVADVLPGTEVSIKGAMKKICDLLEDAAMGGNASLKTPVALHDSYGIPGMVAPIGTDEIYFNAGTLTAMAQVLKMLDKQAEGNYELGFEIIGGKLSIIIADASEL